MSAGSNAEERRRTAAAQYQPAEVKLLLVAETPPTSLERYFYFTNVSQHDSLFRYIAKMLLEREVQRPDKAEALRELQAAGVFLIDIKPDPFDGSALPTLAASLAERCKALRPDSVILIKTSVYDAAFSTLHRAGLPVIDRRIPFPGSGQQKRFEVEFAAALRMSGMAAGDGLGGSPLAPSGPIKASDGSAPTLHAEIARLLADVNDDWMTTEQLAAQVNAAGRYRKRDGSHVTAFQIHGRTRRYARLFERQGAQVRLRVDGTA